MTGKRAFVTRWTLNFIGHRPSMQPTNVKRLCDALDNEYKTKVTIFSHVFLSYLHYHGYSQKNIWLFLIKIFIKDTASFFMHVFSSFNTT